MQVALVGLQSVYAEMTPAAIGLWALALSKFPEDVAIEAITELIMEPHTNDEGRLVKPEPQQAVQICRRILAERRKLAVYDPHCQLCAGSGMKPSRIEGRVTPCGCARMMTRAEIQEQKLLPSTSPEAVEIAPALNEKLKGLAASKTMNPGRPRRPTSLLDRQEMDEQQFEERKELLKRQAESEMKKEAITGNQVKEDKREEENSEPGPAENPVPDQTKASA